MIIKDVTIIKDLIIINNSNNFLGKQWSYEKLFVYE